MAIKKSEIISTMIDAAKIAFGDSWDDVKQYVNVEFKKIGEQLTDILKNVGAYKVDNEKGYSPRTGKLLLQMQRNATESVLVATSILTLIAVQSALNAVFKALKKAFSGALAGVI